MQIKVPIEIIKLEDESYHILVKAVFNHSIPGNLIIDTGASKTVLDKTFVEPFAQDLEVVDDHNSSGINAMIMETSTATIPKLELNDFSISNKTFVLMDLSHINMVYQQYAHMEIAGLIGSDFLVKYRAVIHYGLKQMKLSVK